jgi:2-polyprenyl-3-methyl-5-hydroxy-6-metoxy-1,4-benzoquinol methylase
MKSIFDSVNDAELIGELDPIVISDQWKLFYNIDLGEKFRRLPKIEYWRCNKSKYCWYEPSEAAGDGSLYSKLQRFDWYYMNEKWEFSKTIGLLKKGESILEIGSGPGYFLEAALKNGCFPSSVELNPQAAMILQNKGFKVYESTLKDLANKNTETFNVICSFQVLEHISDAKTFISDMLRLMKPGGRLIFSVPNAAVMRRIDPLNEDLLNMPPHHMGHWDENAFRSLENILPIRVRSIHVEPLADYHVCWMVISYLRGLFPWIHKDIARLIFNKYSTLPVQLLLRAGVRRILPGHSLLVEFEYID